MDEQKTIEQILSDWVGYDVRPINKHLVAAGPLQQSASRAVAQEAAKSYARDLVFVMSDSAWADLGLWGDSNLLFGDQGPRADMRTTEIFGHTYLRPKYAVDVLDERDDLGQLVSTTVYAVPAEGFYEENEDEASQDFGGVSLKITY